MTKHERQKLDCVLRFVAAEDDEARGKEVENARRLISGKTQEPETTNDIIEDLLTQLGARCCNQGYDYLTYAISYLVENPEAIRQITKDIYPAVAKRYSTTKQAAERGIRHEIHYIFDNTYPDELKWLFGNSISADKGAATNGQFIATCAREVERRLREI